MQKDRKVSETGADGRHAQQPRLCGCNPAIDAHANYVN